VQDPTPHIQKHSLAFQCVVSPEKSATIDSSFMRQINWETFYFSDSAAMKKFDSDVLKYCGILTDPITRQRFHPGHNSPQSLYGEKHFYFWSDSSKLKFDMMPATFNVPNLTMEQLHQEGDSI